MADYKKEGKIGDALYMEGKDGGTFNAGIVTDFKDGKIVTKDADGKKHQYSEDNKKIVGFISFDNDDEPTTIADTAPTKPTDAPISSVNNKDRKFTTNHADAIPEAFVGIVDTTASKLNVRAGAGKEFDVIGKLDRGQKVSLTDAEEGWYKLADGSGFVMASYIKRS